MRLFALSIFLLLGQNGFGQKIIVDDNTLVKQIGGEVEVLIDSNASLNAAQAIKSDNYQILGGKTPNLSLKPYKYWIRFVVNNKTNHARLTLNLDQPILNDFVYYTVENGQIVDSQSVGESEVFNSRELKLTSPAILMPVFNGEEREVLLSVISNATLVLDLKVGTTDDIYESYHNKEILLSIYYGIILVMFLYNLFVYISTRESIYLHYVIYIFLLFFIQISIDGFGFKYLWPNSVWLSKQSFFIFTALVNISGIEFVRKFINAREVAPRLDKIRYVIYALYVFILILSISGNRFQAYEILLPLAGVSAIYMVILGIIVALTGSRPAIFFLVAWTPLILGIAISVSKGFGLIEHNNFSNYSIQIGTCLEIVLLSLALADKLNILRTANEQLILTKKAELEIQVKERTEELNQALNRLKNAQTQLVESEKMSSLGQLTAGLAHEINNPVNFITSTIGPLRRDVDDLLQLINNYEEANQISNAEERANKLAQLKTEADLPYLKEEINQLFSAIADGSNRTAAIVKGLKSFSRVDELDIKFVDIHEGLESTLMLLKTLTPSNLIIEKAYGNLPQIECFSGKLNQVFMNILNNSLYIFQNTKVDSPKLTIKTTFDENYAHISLADNGPGMSDEVKAKIFEPFYTTKPIGDGTGLGLSIVFSIIETHKGKIVVNSSPGKGTEFVISIPLKQDD